MPRSALGAPGEVEVLAFRRSFLAEAPVVSLLRVQTGFYLEKWGLSEIAEDARLVVSEFVTNSVKATPGRTVELSVQVEGPVVRIEVFDSSPAPAAPRPASEADESGRGLAIVVCLAKEWGCEPVASGGKVTWATLSCSSPSSSEEPCAVPAAGPGRSAGR